MTFSLRNTPLNQQDPAWSGLLMNRAPGITIGLYGCLITCFGMLAGKNPVEVNEAMLANGGYANVPGSAYAGTFDIRRIFADPKLPELNQFTGKHVFDPFPAVDRERLANWLKDGNPAIVEVDLNPNNSKHEQHFVLACGAYGFGAAAKIVINDPWRGDQVLLVDRYGLTLARALVTAYFYR